MSSIVSQIQAASRDFFVPPFQDWVDHVTRPDATPLELLQAFEHGLYLAFGGREGTEERKEILGTFSIRIAIDLGTETRRLEALKSHKGKPTPTQIRALVQLGENLRESAEGILTQIKVYLSQADVWPLQLKETLSYIRTLLIRMRDHEPMLGQLTEHPKLLSPLELDFPESPIDSFDEDVIDNVLLQKYTAPLFFSWRNLFTWPPPSFRRTNHVEVNLATMAALLGGLTLSQGDLWIDLGTGNGDTLCQLARKFSMASFLGLDLDESLSVQEEKTLGRPHGRNNPSNATYTVLTQTRGVPDSSSFYQGLHDTSLHTAGRHGARVSSIFYPCSTDGDQLAHSAKSMLDTSLDVLQPGGLGFLVTEDLHVLAESVAHLEEKRGKITTLAYAPRPFHGNQLREMGIKPYRPFASEMGIRASNRFARAGTFNWGYMMAFRRA
ncbi:MAG TPA: hypothetical protein DDW49_08760 [Deltaproteobacteria bacterium]|nr:MAG: hypothetical protein A2048_03225 [Deltaproteobacteria bacterium GWA2_45_12]HBF13454.1 hypothetical protein [Deltaproteobacteria bacterium]